jgi:hypothetical protein
MAEYNFGFPLSLPATPKPKKTTFRAVSVVSASVSPFTGQRQVYKHPGEWWEVDITMPIMTRADAETWFGYMLSLQGSYGTFLIGDYDAVTPRGANTGTPVIKGTASGNNFTTTGWTANTLVLKAGDYLQIGNYLYKQLGDTTSNGSGDADLVVWPRLRAPAANGTTLVTTGARGIFSLSSNTFDWSSDDLSLYEVTFSAREAI